MRLQHELRVLNVFHRLKQNPLDYIADVLNQNLELTKFKLMKVAQWTGGTPIFDCY